MPLFGPPDVAKLAAKGDVKGLIKALSYPKDKSVREAAAEELGKRRLAAAMLLGGKADDARPVEPLMAALKDPDPGVREAAAKALAAEARAAETLAALGVPGPVAARSSTVEDEARSVSGSAVERVHPVVGEKPSAEVFVSLGSDDPQARRQAIAVLVSSGYQDPEDTRTFAVFGRSPGVEYGQDDLNDDVEKYPDFDIAYIRAAYPTGRSEDHAHADISRFPEGLASCKAKARLLGRLCSYSTWKGEWLKALDLAVAAVLIGDPSEGPSDMVQVLNFLTAAFLKLELVDEAFLATKVRAPYNLGSEEQAAVNRAVTALTGEYADDVRWAADTVREKLVQTAQEKR